MQVTATQAKNRFGDTCRTPKGAQDAPTFQITTTANPKQEHAFELIAQIKM